MFSQQQQQSQQQYQFACLYTKHKTQKRKVWNDGRLVLKTSHGINKVVLHACTASTTNKLGSFDPSIDECEISILERQSILQNCNGKIIETDKYIIEIDSPWVAATTTSTTVTSTTNNVSGGGALLQGTKRNLKRKPTATSSMEKLLQNKFQIPKPYVPPPPPPPSSSSAHLGHQRLTHSQIMLQKRKRPLQPGELIAMHYGNDNTNGGVQQQQPFQQQQNFGGNIGQAQQPQYQPNHFPSYQNNNNAPPPPPTTTTVVVILWTTTTKHYSKQSTTTTRIECCNG